MAVTIELFDVIQVGMLVISKDRTIVKANALAEKIVGRPISLDHDKLCCHKLFFNRDDCCLDCPISLTESSEISAPMQKSYNLKRPNGEDVFVKSQFSNLNDHIVITLQDVTREVSLLRQLDLNRKEQEAKNSLLNRRRQKAEQEHKFLEQLLDNLPEGLVTVNDSYLITRKNTAVDSMFSATGQKCYELIGNSHPCDQCPAVKGFHVANGFKKSHKIGNQFITETIIYSSNPKGGLLIFQNTTKMIQLIEQIRGQQETITSKNEILSGLVNLASTMQKENDPGKVINFFLEAITPLLEIKAAIVLVDGIRGGGLGLTVQKNVEEVTLMEVTKSYLSRDIQDHQRDTLDHEKIPWPDAKQFVLIGGSGKRVGLIIMHGVFQSEHRDLLHLFTEPLGAYLHNQQLLMLLEERANTDPLTGLYNRAYLDKALLEEKEKFERYGINCSVVVADVNRLKMANDIYGHEAGDNLIITVANLLNNNIRSSDLVARTGGDEFLIVLSNTNEAEANLYINRISMNVFNNQTIPAGDKTFPVTVSLGAAGTDMYPFEELIATADRNMFAAKEAFYQTEKRYR